MTSLAAWGNTSGLAGRQAEEGFSCGNVVVWNQLQERCEKCRWKIVYL
jgi:hypothetical protein